MIVICRGWHRDRGGNRIVDMPIDEISPRQVGPGHPYPRDPERAVSFHEVFYTYTDSYGVRHSIESGNWRALQISKEKPVRRVEGILIRAKGAVTANAEHEVDVFLSKPQLYLLFLQVFGDQAIRTLLQPPPELMRREAVAFDSGVEALKDEADDRG